MSRNLELLIEENNALMRQQTEQLASVRALLQTIMVYLPACASGREVDRKEVMRIAKAHAATEIALRPKRLRFRPKRKTY
jgi:hypothetical protein